MRGWGTGYHARVDADLIDGPNNDVARVFFSTDADAGAPRVVATTFEQFYWPSGMAPLAVAYSAMRIDDSNHGFTPQGAYLEPGSGAARLRRLGPRSCSFSPFGAVGIGRAWC
jgi:hypothetical protein